MPARNLSCRYVRVEPDALERVAPLADGHFENGHAAGAEEAEGADFGDDAGHLAGAELANAARVEAIFVAEGQVVEQVFDRADAFFQQDLGKSRADAFDVLNVGGELEHRVMVNQPSAFSRQHSAIPILTEC